MNEDKKGFLRPRLLLISFGVVLYVLLQNFDKVKNSVSWIAGVFSPVIYGLCIAFALNVFMSFFERLFSRLSKGKLRGLLLRVASLLLTLVISLGLVTTVIFLIIPAIGDTITLVISYLPESTSDLTRWAGDTLRDIGISEDLIAPLQTKLTELANELLTYLNTEVLGMMNTALNVTTSVLSAFMSFIVSLIFAIYTLISKDKIGRFVIAALERFLPDKYNRPLMRVSKLSYESFSCFVKGQLLEACILGMLCFIGMLLLRLPNAALVSLLIGVTALIPIFGAWIGGAVSAFLILLVSPVKALIFVIYLLVLQQIEGNLIYPRVVGQSLGLPGILVLFAVLIGSNMFGVSGILISVPLCAVLYTLLREAVFGIKAARAGDSPSPAPPEKEPKKRKSR